MRAGVLKEGELNAALDIQARSGGQLGQLLVSLGHLEEAVLIRALSKHLGVELADLRNIRNRVQPDVARLVDANDARARFYCPERLDKSRNTLVVAMTDPTDLPLIDELAFRTGYRIETTIAATNEVTKAVEELYFGASSVDPFASFDHAQVLAQGPLREVDLDSVRIPTSGTSRIPTSGTSRFPTSERSRIPPPAITSPFERFGPLPRELEPEETSNDLSTQRHPEHTDEADPTLPEAPAPLEAAEKLKSAQSRQNRVIRALIDLLIDQGVFTEDAFRNKLLEVSARRRR